MAKFQLMDNEFLSVRSVLEIINYAFVSAKAFLNYELRITNYEFGRRPLNCNLIDRINFTPYYNTVPRRLQEEGSNFFLFCTNFPLLPSKIWWIPLTIFPLSFIIRVARDALYFPAFYGGKESV